MHHFKKKRNCTEHIKYIFKWPKTCIFQWKMKRCLSPAYIFMTLAQTSGQRCIVTKVILSLEYVWNTLWLMSISMKFYEVQIEMIFKTKAYKFTSCISQFRRWATSFCHSSANQIYWRQRWLDVVHPTAYSISVVGVGPTLFCHSSAKHVSSIFPTCDRADHLRQVFCLSRQRQFAIWGPGVLNFHFGRGGRPEGSRA